MSIPTKSEALFESFLQANGLAFERIPEASGRRPDYWVTTDGGKLAFEVKELTKDDNFKPEGSSRTVGDHIRAKVREARTQIQFGARQGIPSILLIYNALDPIQRFGTEGHDFRDAMYGALTLPLNQDGRIVGPAFHGKNAEFRAERNTSFGAIGLLIDRQGFPEVTLHENLHATVSVPFAALPPCFGAVRYEIDPSLV